MKVFIRFLLSAVVMFGLGSAQAFSESVDLTIKSHYGGGFFCELSKVVDNIIHYSDKNFENISIDWTDEFFLYKDSPYENGWELYFEPIVLPESYEFENVVKAISGKSYHEIHDHLCIDHWINYHSYLPYRMRIHSVLNKYVKVKKHIKDEVDLIVKTLMSDFYCIGAHVRYGSDHASEEPAGHPSINDYIVKIKNLINKNSHKPVKIYLATDSKYVVKKFKKIFSKSMIITIDTCRTEYRDVPHLVYGNGDYWLANKSKFHQKKPGYYGGKGVLMDCLLLSHCDVFIHTTSNIASFVTFFNPTIRSIYLPKPKTSWPCRHGK